MKSAQIVQCLASDAVRWQEDNNAPRKQYQFVHNLKIISVLLKFYALAAILTGNNVDE